MQVQGWTIQPLPQMTNCVCIELAHTSNKKHIILTGIMCFLLFALLRIFFQKSRRFYASIIKFKNNKKRKKS